MIISWPIDSKGERHAMNILCLLRKDPDATIVGILDVQKQAHAVTVVDIRKDKDYDRIIALISSSTRIISW